MLPSLHGGDGGSRVLRLLAVLQSGDQGDWIGDGMGDGVYPSGAVYPSVSFCYPLVFRHGCYPQVIHDDGYPGVSLLDRLVGVVSLYPQACHGYPVSLFQLTDFAPCDSEFYGYPLLVEEGDAAALAQDVYYRLDHVGFPYVDGVADDPWERRPG